MFNYFHKTENNEFVDGFWKKNKSSSQYSDVNFWLVAAGREAEREKIWNEFKNNNR